MCCLSSGLFLDAGGAPSQDFLKANRSQLPPVRLLSVLTDIAAGMVFVHSKQIIHRDLKVSPPLPLHSLSLRGLRTALRRRGGLARYGACADAGGKHFGRHRVQMQGEADPTRSTPPAPHN